MSFEVEVKYRAVDHDHLVECLVQMGAVTGEAVDHEDTYLSHPARDFTQTREEIEIPVAAGPDQFRRLLTLLENLGFRPVATVRKRRESFHLTFHEHELEIALDTAEGL